MNEIVELDISTAGKYISDATTRPGYVFTQNGTDIYISVVLIPELMIGAVRLTGDDTLICSNILETVSTKIEKMGYFKFWIVSTESKLNELSLPRYESYDEWVVKRGTKSSFLAQNANRLIDNDNDNIVRLYMLKQEYRVEHLKLHGYEGYKGTLMESVCHKK